MGWVAGPSAQVELFSPSAGSRRGYQIKYTPPFRSTIRPPVAEGQVGPEELEPIRDELGRVVAKLRGRSPPAGGAAARAAPSADEVLADMELIGDQLFTFLIPRFVQLDLRTSGLFLEIGMDEALLSFPWELMYDGDDFLCLKHKTGRFVNASSQFPMATRPKARLGESLEELSILIVSVPNPQPRDRETIYEDLPEAEAETEAIVESLAGIEGVTLEVLFKREAKFDDVYQAVRSREYHIIHFNGHARFDDQYPYRSGLVLFDRDMATGHLATTIGRKPPLLCFINGCETAKSLDATESKSRYDVYGLARAFLDTGAYLLGSRWKVNDESAAEFAKQFYTSLLEEGKSLGHAILDARQSCKQAVPTDPLGWASYVFYGDPRVGFLRR